MRGFLLKNGDIVIGKPNTNTILPNGNQIMLIEGNDLIAQKIAIVLGMFAGEWFWNSSLGINYDFIIGKNITEDMIRSQIEVGIRQVSPNMYLDSFEIDINKSERTASITFVVGDDNGNVAKIEKTFGAEINTVANIITYER